MKRKASIVSQKELEYLVKEFATEKGEEIDFEEEQIDIYTLIENCPKIEKDLEKVEFDLENYETDPDGFRDHMPLVGYQTIGELTFLGVSAGGDWEIPIFFLIYVDEKNKLRAYIPSKGNAYNTQTKSAYGNYEDEDEEQAKKLGYSSMVELYDADNLYNWEQIEEEIKNRFEIIK